MLNIGNHNATDCKETQGYAALVKGFQALVDLAAQLWIHILIGKSY